MQMIKDMDGTHWQDRDNMLFNRDHHLRDAKKRDIAIAIATIIAPSHMTIKWWYAYHFPLWVVYAIGLPTKNT